MLPSYHRFIQPDGAEGVRRFFTLLLIVFLETIGSPKVQQAGLKVKDDLDIEVRKRALVLRPHLRRVYRLEDLLKRMSPRNVHKEIDFGGPVGREAL